jgi:hypothetical protein
MNESKNLRVPSGVHVLSIQNGIPVVINLDSNSYNVAQVNEI